MLDPGTSLGPYTILAPLGAGGMGEVYRAHDPRLGRDVAVKILPARLSSPDFRARFEREARAISQLNHPNICTLHDVGHDRGLDYLVMELLEGETLTARLGRGPLPIHELLEIGVQIAAALGRAHRAGLVHRDLKPGNLICTESGVKLLDFGLARPVAPPREEPSSSQAPTVNQPITASGAVVGTFQYMSPEQLEGREADARSDLFALGCVLYEMATGRRPFTGRDGAAILASIVRDTPEPASRLNARMPRGLDPIVGRCLEKDPARRPESAAELSDELVRLQQWARNEGLPELARIGERILALEEGPDSWTAFLLAREIEKLAPGDPMLERLRPDFSLPISIATDPPGAAAFACFYGEPDGEWLDLGRTPLERIPYPRGLTRLRLELAGHRTTHDLVWNLSRGFNDATDPDDGCWRYTLVRPGEVPDEMEPVPAGEFPLYMPGIDHLKPEPTGAFLVDRHPVTNRDYQRFMAARGYERGAHWREPFVEGDRELVWEEAMARFVDATGQRGPSTWVMGEYPEGEGDHPVTGVSWFEAAAYAAWADKALPTLFHWNRVALTIAGAQIAPLANLAGRGTVPVGSTRSVNRFGVHDLAGNVREWALNAVDRPGERFILGGGWNDPGYAFVDGYAQPAFDRSAANGFRCIRPLAPDPNAANLERAVEVPFRDFRAEQAVSDDVFGYFLRQFQYDRAPLDAAIVGDQASPSGRWQTIQWAAAYGGERMTAHLFLPARSRPPYQTVVLFPGSLAIHTRVFDAAEIRRVDFLVKSGRALLLPVYKGTYERGGELTSDYPEETAAYKDHVVMWARDLGRTIDYVESREDLDASRIAYFGVSWGGALGAILPAVEKRIRANVLYVAGLNFQRALPEADQIHYVGRVTQPTLMLNGELDFFFPAETSQKPMFERLGTPAEHKKRLTYPRGHTVPKLELIRESLAWLDRYLGPVE
jgi:serine/threonine protein kinase/dienelactone hydrolase